MWMLVMVICMVKKLVEGLVVIRVMMVAVMIMNCVGGIRQ